MTGEVRIGTKPVLICGNAATPIRYKQLFRQDLLSSLSRMTADEFDADTLTQLFYVMHLQATGADFRAVTFESFCDWLSQFEQTDVLEKVGEVLGFWMQTSKTGVKSKKN